MTSTFPIAEHLPALPLAAPLPEPSSPIDQVVLGVDLDPLLVDGLVPFMSIVDGDHVQIIPLLQILSDFSADPLKQRLDLSLKRNRLISNDQKEMGGPSPNGQTDQKTFENSITVSQMILQIRDQFGIPI